MKIDFRRKKSVPQIVVAIGTVNYETLVMLGEKHGLTANEVYDQLNLALEEGTVFAYRKFASPVVYQDPEMNRRYKESKANKAAVDRAKINEDMVESLKNHVDEIYEDHNQFHIGMLEKELKFWEQDGGEEREWDKVHLQATINHLVKDGYLTKGKWIWFYRHDWSEEKQKTWRRNKKKDKEES